MAASVLASPFKVSAIKKDVVVMPAVVDITSPTRAEINAGTNIKYHLDKDNGLAGFTLTPQSVTATSLGDGIGYALDDGSSYDQASFTCHMSKTGKTHDVRSVFTEGTDYYVAIFDTTDTAGLAMDVFAITVRPITKTRSGVQMLTVPVDISNSARDVTVPA